MKRYISEGIGTFALVFCGTGALVINGISGGAVTHAGIAITFGLVVLSMIYAFGDISGAHINPAVTFGFTLMRRIHWREAIMYIVSQLTGAVVASLVLKMLFPQNADLGATFPAGSDWQSFFLEMICTFFLLLVILNVSTGAKEKGITAGLAISSVIGMEAMFAGPISGASMNPARSFAPALVSGNFHSLWIYLLAPPAGAVLAVLAYHLIHSSTPQS